MVRSSLCIRVVKIPVVLLIPPDLGPEDIHDLTASPYSLAGDPGQVLHRLERAEVIAHRHSIAVGDRQPGRELQVLPGPLLLEGLIPDALVTCFSESLQKGTIGCEHRRHGPVSGISL